MRRAEVAAKPAYLRAWQQSLWTLLLASSALSSSAQDAGTTPPTESTPAKAALLHSAEDGAFDMSGFLDQAHGFVPVIIPITEPALGLGGALALVFIDKGQSGERPDISAVGGLKTDNGTHGLFLADSRYWHGGSLQSMAAGMDAEVNLEFYGAGGAPRAYTLDTRMGFLQGKLRIGESRSWLGAGYLLMDASARFDTVQDIPQLPDLERRVRSAGLLAGYTHDSRDNLFTPNSGNYLDASAALFSEALGSDGDFQRVMLTGIHYRPLSETVFLGVMGSAAFSYGDSPFYLIPAISMRGVPAMSYQGRQVAQLEAELRWRFSPRYSAVAFAGTGRAKDLSERFGEARIASAGGLGIRYEIARKYGLHMGIDAAHGPEGMAYYVQFGSAWMRP